MKESELTKQILSYLAGRGHFAYKQWGGMFSKRGMSDIVGAQKDTGVAIFLEVKTPTGKVSDDQELFLFEAELVGAITGVVRNLQDVKRLGL